MEVRLGGIESRLGAMEQRFGAQEERMTRMLSLLVGVAERADGGRPNQS